jgi:predicted hydrocarbon binding protein
MEYHASQGELREGDARYLVLRDDSLMGMFRRLPADARREALRALAESVAEHGGRSARRYLVMGTAGSGEFLASLEETAAQLGWGVWRFSGIEIGELHLEVENSPFAHGYGASQEVVCAPITGMLGAVASIVLGAPAQAEEHTCASAGGAICRFSARPENP